jgi:formylglycine-generating enzyme required for sulfatase activity
MRTLAVLFLALTVCAPSQAGEPKVYTKWPFDAAEAKRRQAETAKALGVEVERDIETAPGVKMRLVLIPAGEFLMGTPENEEIREEIETPHRVRLTQPFWVGKYEVTVEQYRAFVQSTRYQTDAEKAGEAFGYKDGEFDLHEGITWSNAMPDQTDSHPVTCASWNDATAFCAWLSRKAVGACRLATEAQWEYACRGGTSTQFHSGDTISTEQANYNGDHPHAGGLKGVYRRKTLPVGTLPANAWGLHDMAGNVLEWCADWYDEDYYKASPAEDPPGASRGEERVLRGGSWDFCPVHCRSASRGSFQPWVTSASFGFRVVLPVKSSQ